MKHWGKLECLWLKFSCPCRADLQGEVGLLDNVQKTHRMRAVWQESLVSEGEELSKHRHSAIINIVLPCLALFKARVDGALTSLI